ncbi:hypothetical protein Tsubulata_012496 [Turnera subulata]|uniref:Uncharacterized protein n=1 Tax=Turnera subulata TaxID=218843 RepID=A0A9Q0G9F6_9ROSI|nr:hypothetical protein Tsubulata_012496 [Turnera subulata]
MKSKLSQVQIDLEGFDCSSDFNPTPHQPDPIGPPSSSSSAASSPYKNGDTYAGEYFGDMMHGFGVYCFANGHRYEGAWHEGRMQGLDMYTFSNGENLSAHRQIGILDVPSTQNTAYPVSLLVFIIPKYSMRCRKHGMQEKRLMM